jgi:YVTN family beta-propeller protein
MGSGAVWVASTVGGRVSRIDPATGTVTETIELGVNPAALAFGFGDLWVAVPSDQSLIRLDPAAGTARATVSLPLRPSAIAVGDGAVWAASHDSGTVTQVDPESNRALATVEVGEGPAAIAVAAGSVWVANSLDGTVSRIDPRTARVVATIPTGSGASALAGARNSLWVANRFSGTVTRIDVNRGTVTKTIPLGGRPMVAATTGSTLWIGALPSLRHHGGTLTLVKTRPLSIDPALQYDLPPLQADGLTRDGLVTLEHVGGVEGLRLVPDLALGLPIPTDGGTTYSFRIRPGIRYSNGSPLQAGDFRRAIERLFRMRSPASSFFVEIVGAGTCAGAGARRCDLSRGIVTNDLSRSVIFHLIAPDSNFLYKLAIGAFTTPVPPGTPFRDTHWKPIPGTGPYRIASARSREIHYVRNPFFREWSHAAQPNGTADEIVWRFGLSPSQEVRAVEHGKADLMNDAIPAPLLPVLKRRFTAQFHSNPSPGTDFFQINTKRPPFNDGRVRQALNLAIDRRVIVRIYGGNNAATPTCQVLPPGTPGYRRYCPYTRAPTSDGSWRTPDLARARRLVAASGTRGASVTIWGWTDDTALSPRVVEYVRDVLHRLGYRVRTRYFSHAQLATVPRSFFARANLIPAAWFADYPSAYDFFGLWFACRGAFSSPFFCDHRIDQQIRHAASLEETNPQHAASLWAAIDRELVDQAAWLPLVNRRQIEFVSARVHNYQHNPFWGVVASQLWLR